MTIHEWMSHPDTKVYGMPNGVVASGIIDSGVLKTDKSDNTQAEADAWREAWERHKAKWQDKRDTQSYAGYTDKGPPDGYVWLVERECATCSGGGRGMGYSGVDKCISCNGTGKRYDIVRQDAEPVRLLEIVRNRGDVTVEEIVNGIKYMQFAALLFVGPEPGQRETVYREESPCHDDSEKQ
jgi:hypothetical protein